MNKTALAPCPFCGSSNVAQGASREFISVWCFCGARGPDVPFPDNCIDPATPIQKCYEAWNRRSPAPAPAGGVTVRQLEWVFDDVRKFWYGNAAIPPHYRVRGSQWCIVGKEGCQYQCGSEAEAKAAAQEDFNARIRSALLPSESAEKVGVVDGAALIAAERRRQVEQEGWTAEHDDTHDKGEMARAGAGYAFHAGLTDEQRAKGLPQGWPAGWAFSWWKPSDRIRDLVKAGALIAAEIDRLQRLAPASPSPATGEA